MPGGDYKTNKSDKAFNTNFATPHFQYLVQETH